ncbi:hypothetical protein [Buttiauxella noackiae]|uniref:hypothetical protein n=1 Tax=Buttiauxella noackiae TaxID=82992 RepID=UPI0028D695E3|nr:hypothetical protein [Buttiauxella noackiae]
MEIIYGINVIFSLLFYFSFALLAKSILKLPWLNPFVISAIVLLPVFFLENIVAPLFYGNQYYNNEYYNQALLIANIYALVNVIAIFFYYFFIRHIIPWKKNKNTVTNYCISNHLILKRISNVTCILFVIFYILLTTNSELGLLGWLVNPRDGYQNYRTGNGFLYAMSLNMLSVSYFSRCFTARSDKWIFIYTCIYCVLAFYLGSKTFILSFAIFYLSVLSIKRSTHLKFGLIIVIPVAAVAVLYNLYLAIGQMSVDVVFAYFDQYHNSIMFLEDLAHNRVDFFHGDVIFSEFWEFIPRTLDSAKPFVYGFLKVNEIYYPGAAESGHTPAFSKGMENFVDYGYGGLVFITFLSPVNIMYGYIFAKLKYLNFNTPSSSPLNFVLCLILIAPSFGTFFVGPAYMFLLLCFGFIALMGKHYFRPALEHKF